MKKKFAVLTALCAAMTLAFPSAGFAADVPEKETERPNRYEVELKIGEKKFRVDREERPMLVPAYISEKGYTMLPVREVAEIFPDSVVKWDAQEKKVFLTCRGKNIMMQLGTNKAEIDGKTVTLRVPVSEKDGRTFLGLRDLCDLVYVRDLNWWGPTRTVKMEIAEDIVGDTIWEDAAYKNHDDSQVIAYLKENVDPKFDKELFKKCEIGTLAGDADSGLLVYEYWIGSLPTNFSYMLFIEDHKAVAWERIGEPVYDYQIPEGVSVEKIKEEKLKAFQEKHGTKNVKERNITAMLISQTREIIYTVHTTYESSEGFIHLQDNRV